MEGIIDRKIDDKGFGFIKASEEKSYFFHFSDVENEIDGYNELNEGDTVSFEVVEWRDGKEKAINVKLA